MQGQQKYFLLFSISLFFAFLPYKTQAQQAKDCHQFKKGFFLFESDSGEVYLIKRKRKQQKEIELKSGNEAVTEIKWLADCVYQLTQEKTDSLQIINIPIVIRIESIDGKSYDFISSSFDDLISFNGRMRKIRRREYRKLIINYQ